LNIVKAVDYGKRIKVYPLSTAANRPATTFVDAINVVYDTTIPYDIRFSRRSTASYRGSAQERTGSERRLEIWIVDARVEVAMPH